MTTLAARWHAIKALRPSPAAARRAILAGTSWGLVVGLGLPILTFLGCGMICLSDIALTTAIAVPAGILAIGPLAAFGRSADAPSVELR